MQAAKKLIEQLEAERIAAEEEARRQAEAEAAAAATLHDVREAMRINYFDDEALMNQPYEKQN